MNKRVVGNGGSVSYSNKEERDQLPNLEVSYQYLLFSSVSVAIQLTERYNSSDVQPASHKWITVTDTANTITPSLPHYIYRYIYMLLVVISIQPPPSHNSTCSLCRTPTSTPLSVPSPVRPKALATPQSADFTVLFIMSPHSQVPFAFIISPIHYFFLFLYFICRSFGLRTDTSIICIF